jgi:mono/diheme cytochrome c family protein
MEYPLFDVPMAGGSMLIAAVAVFHVYIAQFSIGAALFTVTAERRALRRGDRGTLDFLRRYATLILVVPYVLGTTTGVGIWLVISLVSPRAASVLIHQFVWGWATEWVLFVIEVAAIYLYVYTWDRIRPRAHNRIGWVFAAASLLTLPIINGILSFMLTPGAWRAGEPGAFWTGFFNPSWLPTTLIRLLVCLALGGAGVLLLLSLARGVADDVRERLSRRAWWFIAPIWLVLPLAAWTFAVLPPRAQVFLTGGAPVMQVFMGTGLALLLALAATAAVALVRRDWSPSPSRAALVVLAAFVGYGAMEFVREGIRKPFIIEGFMYSTGVTVPEAAGLDPRGHVDATRAAGILATAPFALPPSRRAEQFRTLDRGRAVFTAACARCHTLDGYNAVRPLVTGWSSEALHLLVAHMHEMKPTMPPFPGNAADAESLVAYLGEVGGDSARRPVFAAPLAGRSPPEGSASPVPAYDLLGLPLPPWILRALMALTLALHWLLIGGAFAGTVLVGADRLRPSPSPGLRPPSPVKGEGKGGPSPLAWRMIPFITLGVSMGVTLGIAPLLFVQVLYGNFFYTSNILLGAWWLALVPLVVGILYLWYWARRHAYAGRPVPAWAAPAAALLFVATATILGSNALLSQSPGEWLRIHHAAGGGALFMDATFPARWGLALAGLLAAGGLLVALVGRLGVLGDAEASQIATRAGLRLASWTAPLAAAAAVALAIAQPQAVREAVAQGQGLAWLVLAAGGLALTAALAWLARLRPTRLAVTAATAAALVTLLATALLRDVARQAAIAPVETLSGAVLRPQWGPFAMFLVAFVIGVAVVAWLIRLARTRDEGDAA